MLTCIELCSCGEVAREGQRYCTKCHATYMRQWRKTHSLTDQQRKKDNCRSYAQVYMKRGLLIRQPCEECGSVNSQKHHLDYNHPLLVMWLCRSCRLERNRLENELTH